MGTPSPKQPSSPQGSQLQGSPSESSSPAVAGVGSPGLNVALLVGRLSAEPQQRTLPSGSVAVSLAVTVRSPEIKTTSVPAVWYDPPARVTKWKVGDEIVVQGEVVRRFFRGRSGLGSATEVVVARGELLRHQKKVDRLFDAAANALARTRAKLEI